MVHSFAQGPVQHVSREPRAIPPDAGHAPVFVLTTARSESAFLRMVLDSHPGLARPPEAGAAFGYGRLARVMGVLDRLYRFGPLSGDLVAGMPLHVVLESYAQRPGNARWPGNPVDCIVFAHRLASLWPRSQFICLTRHCSDVITSSLDASRWAMSGAGLGPDVDPGPGPGSAADAAEAAVAAFWLASAQAIVAFSQSYPGRCHHLRHEDLSTDPEGTTGRLFSFLGVPPPELTPMPGPPAYQVPVTDWPPGAADSLDQVLTALGYPKMDEHRTPHGPRA
jgi:protein-tyrosine sulfotransferase